LTDILPNQYLVQIGKNLDLSVGLGHVNVCGTIRMKINAFVGLRCRLTQPTENGQGIANKMQFFGF
jgi:hypothetical protein